MHKGQSSKEQRVRLREGSTMRAVPYVHCGPLAQNENLVCKARVRIRLYERFPRFLHFVLVLSQARSVTIQGWAQGFGIKDAADHIKAREYLQPLDPPYPLFQDPPKTRSRAFVPHKLRRAPLLGRMHPLSNEMLLYRQNHRIYPRSYYSAAINDEHLVTEGLVSIERTRSCRRKVPSSRTSHSPPRIRLNSIELEVDRER